MGALWLTFKVSGDLARRASRLINPLLLLVILLTIVSLIATVAVRPTSLNNYYRYPVTFIVPVGVLAALAGIWWFNRNQQPVKAFLSSALLSVLYAGRSMLGPLSYGAACLHRRDRDITIARAISGPHTLSVGLAWWSFGMTLAIAYVVFVYSRFKGKVDAESAH